MQLVYNFIRVGVCLVGCGSVSVCVSLVGKLNLKLVKEMPVKTQQEVNK